MFAMLLGAWPRVTADGVRLEALHAPEADVDRCVSDALAAQAAAGMGLVTDGWIRWPDPRQAMLAALDAGDTGPDGQLLRAWRWAAGRSEVPVAAAILGPWSLAIADVGGWGDPDMVAGRALELAGGQADDVEALAAAGCPVLQVLEPGLLAVGEDAAARAGFLRAQHRLLARLGSVHAMLAVVGGSALPAGAATLFDAPYASYAFDLVAGPDNWHLVREAPAERGIVCAALRAGNGAERQDQSPELVWAAHYAASSRGRGLERVGLANATSLGTLELPAAVAALEAVGRAAAFAAMAPGEAVARGLDSRTVSHPVAPKARRQAPRS